MQGMKSFDGGGRVTSAVPHLKATLVGGSALIYESLRAYTHLQGIALEWAENLEDALDVLQSDRNALGDLFCIQSAFDDIFDVLWPSGAREVSVPRIFPIIEPASGYSDADFSEDAVDGILRAPLRYGEVALVVGSRVRGQSRVKDPYEAMVRGTVLLVEDDEINRMIAQRMLESFGCTVLHAGDGYEALRLLGSESIDLVLMDLGIPEIDGLTATRTARVREESDGRHIPIVAMTADVLADVRERCEEAGMDGFMAKPISRSDLAETVANWLPKREIREVS